jgi:ABC-type bacteriocin/lantibiotic exporter with double-glycine peptidase domain
MIVKRLEISAVRRSLPVYPGRHFLSGYVLAALLGLGINGTDAQARSALPTAMRLQTLPFAYQTFNNCGPQAIASVLGYYGRQVSQQQVAAVAKATPRGYMTAEAIERYVARYGLQARRFVGGRRAHLRSLVALGVPVIVLQWLGPGSTVPHFRVVTGFDDGRQAFRVLDPLYGPQISIPYALFDQLWTVNHAEFIPVYPPNTAPAVRSALGI